MHFDKDEWISHKAGAKAFVKAICCLCIKALMAMGNSMTNARIIQVQDLTVHCVQCIYLVY